MPQTVQGGASAWPLEVRRGSSVRPPRIASDGSAATSVYFRDPDLNLIELLTTDGIDPSQRPPIELR